MHGNVAEWTLDLAGPYSGGHAPGDGLLQQSSSKDERVIRGGCLDTTTPGARSADRADLKQAMSRSVVGVRAARDIAP
jgi:formylglycine-generating enzyme required for sulfatase activity